MDHTNLTSAEQLRSDEQLRQERETFNQTMRHRNLWFVLTITIGYTATLLLAVIALATLYILFNHSEFTLYVVNFAGPALLVDVLGVIVIVWKTFIAPGYQPELTPITRLDAKDGPIEKPTNKNI